MFVLGLGSNLGDRLAQLKRAVALLKKIPNTHIQAISPIYSSDALLPKNASPHWNTPFLNIAVRGETTLSPQILLQQIKEIEKKIGRTPEKEWGPRIIDIDILAWDELIHNDEALQIPHQHLHTRPFALWPLADLLPHWQHPVLQKTATELAAAWGSRLSGEAPLHTKQIPHRIEDPELVGILNITPDSFSDGGHYNDIENALTQFNQLVSAGATIIDIGAESTRPNAQPVTTEKEWQRLEPFLQAITAQTTPLIIKPKISIDTYHADIAKKALSSFAIDWINDVSGLDDRLMRRVIAEHQCDVVIMHHLGIPADKNKVLPEKEDVVSTVLNWAEKRVAELEKEGITRERIIFDVGIGYGKTPSQSFELIKQIEMFHSLSVRLLVGHSRKSFLTLFTDKPAHERDIETLAISIHLAKCGISYLRVHNIDLHARALFI